jgi:hypothetical protein
MSYINFHDADIHGEYSNDFIYRLDGNNLVSLPSTVSDFFGSDTIGLFDKNKKFILNQESDPLIKYSLNSYGFRCNDFNSEDVKNNFIYSGCSIGFGLGLPSNGSWPYQLNKLMNKNSYYNLSVPGMAIEQIIWNLFTFIKKFGNPKGIFILFPDIDRSIKLNRTEQDNRRSFFITTNNESIIENQEDKQKELLKAFHLIDMLEIYCNSHNIELLWSSWSTYLTESIVKNNYTFLNFMNMANLEIEYDSMILKRLLSGDVLKKPKELDNKYWKIARDNLHPGTQQQRIYALAFKKEYERRYEK